MSRESKVIRNTSILAAQHILINAITIFVVAYIARKLGKQDYGIYSLAFAFPMIFEYVGSLGLRPLALRELSRDRENAIDYLGKMIPIRIVLILLTAVIVFMAALTLKYETKIIYAVVIAIGSSICEQLSRIVLDVFQAFEEMGRIAFRDVTVRIFTAAASISVLLVGYGLFAVCLVYMAGSVLGLLINVWMYRRRFAIPKMRIDYKFLRHSLNESKSFILIGFASALYNRIDILLLSKLTDSGSLGIYNASANLFFRLNFIADALATASFPALCELYWTNREEANNIFNKALLPLLILSLPIAVGGFILSKQIITLIYGGSYVESSKVFSIFIITTPIMFLNTLLVSSLNAVKQQRFVAMAVSGTVAASLIMNFLFINWIGYVGAAVAELLAKIFLFLIVLQASRRYLKYSLEANSILSILGSVAILGLISYMASPLRVYITIPLAAAVYYICLKVSGQVKSIRLPGRIF